MAFVEVTLTHSSGAEMAAVERRMQRCPEVIQCSELAGEVDYLITVLVLRQTKNEFVRPI